MNIAHVVAGWWNQLLAFFQRKDTRPPESRQTESSRIVGGRFTLPGLAHMRFGRYSDNNKSVVKTQNWYRAEDLFKEKRYAEAFASFFEYLGDDHEGNVQFQQDGEHFEFTVIQGSKKVHGVIRNGLVSARAPLVRMETPSTAVMRRMLEMNYALYYTHSAMDKDNIVYLVLNANVHSANPGKFYYALRELATHADRQDDLLIADFPDLKPIDTEHVRQVPSAEMQVKYTWLKIWIDETLKQISELNSDSFSGAIAYLLLSLIYRIDFLLLPESKLLQQIEKISSVYWDKKDEMTLVERNQIMIEYVARLSSMTQEEFQKNIHLSQSTFSIATPAKEAKIRDSILGANNDAKWYIEHKHPGIALAINEYGLAHNPFVYNLPQVQIDLILIYMAVLHGRFFQDLGMEKLLYDGESQLFDQSAIRQYVDETIAYHASKYKKLGWEHSRVSYANLYEFGTSFSNQIANLNLELEKIVEE